VKKKKKKKVAKKKSKKPVASQKNLSITVIGGASTLKHTQGGTTLQVFTADSGYPPNCATVYPEALDDKEPKHVYCEKHTCDKECHLIEQEYDPKDPQRTVSEKDLGTGWDKNNQFQLTRKANTRYVCQCGPLLA